MRGIVKGGEKPQILQQPVHAGDIDCDQSMNKDDEEIKIDTSSQRPNLSKEDSWMREYQLDIKIQDYQKCSSCNENISPKDEQLQAYTILQCMHMIHKDCLK